jgi:cyclic pyranopterin phosphate synthase
LRDLRLSVTDRCNNRCPYCMPREQYERFQFIRSDQRLGFAEILRLTRIFVRLGVRKLRITGGEPLLRQGLTELIGDLSQLSGLEDIALATNGVLLAQQAAGLKAAGLHRVSVSLDSLDPEVFGRMTGGFGHPGVVLAGIQAAREQGLTPVKVNAVIKRGVNDHTALGLVEHFRGTGAVLRFIEYMDVGTRNAWRPEHVVPSAELIERIHARWPIRPADANYAGEVAARYAFDDGAGEIGFISSVTRPCTPTRARPSADGVLWCPFAPQGIDLRQPRCWRDEELAVHRFEGDDRYSELRAARACCGRNAPPGRCSAHADRQPILLVTTPQGRWRPVRSLSAGGLVFLMVALLGLTGSRSGRWSRPHGGELIQLLSAYAPSRGHYAAFSKSASIRCSRAGTAWRSSSPASPRTSRWR